MAPVTGLSRRKTCPTPRSQAGKKSCTSNMEEAKRGGSGKDGGPSPWVGRCVELLAASSIHQHTRTKGKVRGGTFQVEKTPDRALMTTTESTAPRTRYGQNKPSVARKVASPIPTRMPL